MSKTFKEFSSDSEAYNRFKAEVDEYDVELLADRYDRCFPFGVSIYSGDRYTAKQFIVGMTLTLGGGADAFEKVTKYVEAAEAKAAKGLGVFSTAETRAAVLNQFHIDGEDSADAEMSEEYDDDVLDDEDIEIDDLELQEAIIEIMESEGIDMSEEKEALEELKESKSESDDTPTPKAEHPESGPTSSSSKPTAAAPVSSASSIMTNISTSGFTGVTLSEGSENETDEQAKARIRSNLEKQIRAFHQKLADEKKQADALIAHSKKLEAEQKRIIDGFFSDPNKDPLFAFSYSPDFCLNEITRFSEVSDDLERRSDRKNTIVDTEELDEAEREVRKSLNKLKDREVEKAKEEVEKKLEKLGNPPEKTALRQIGDKGQEIKAEEAKKKEKTDFERAMSLYWETDTGKKNIKSVRMKSAWAAHKMRCFATNKKFSRPTKQDFAVAEDSIQWMKDQHSRSKMTMNAAVRQSLIIVADKHKTTVPHHSTLKAFENRMKKQSSSELKR